MNEGRATRGSDPSQPNPCVINCADELRHRFQGITTVEQIEEVLREERPPKRCPATIVFQDDPHIRDRELARAVPNTPRNWTHYRVYVREFLRSDPTALLHVLAHELCHVVFGELANEFDADSFGARLLGLSYEDFRAVIQTCESRI
jgi:hypothetical protein